MDLTLSWMHSNKEGSISHPHCCSDELKEGGSVEIQVMNISRGLEGIGTLVRQCRNDLKAVRYLSWESSSPWTHVSFWFCCQGELGNAVTDEPRGGGNCHAWSCLLTLTAYFFLSPSSLLRPWNSWWIYPTVSMIMSGGIKIIQKISVYCISFVVCTDWCGIIL